MTIRQYGLRGQIFSGPGESLFVVGAGVYRPPSKRMDGPRCVKTGALSHSVILQKTGAFWASRGAGAAAAPVDAGFPNTAFLPEMLSFWPRSWSARSEPEVVIDPSCPGIVGPIPRICPFRTSEADRRDDP